MRGTMTAGPTVPTSGTAWVRSRNHAVSLVEVFRRRPPQDGKYHEHHKHRKGPVARRFASIGTRTLSFRSTPT
ncbi:hypothetical protein HYQ46_009712 [Verticillium longisporum]|nr:hypothetical protein HYQ46_009712 [Verticillium longisporum]